MQFFDIITFLFWQKWFLPVWDWSYWQLHAALEWCIRTTNERCQPSASLEILLVNHLIRQVLFKLFWSAMASDCFWNCLFKSILACHVIYLSLVQSVGHCHLKIRLKCNLFFCIYREITDWVDVCSSRGYLGHWLWRSC